MRGTPASALLASALWLLAGCPGGPDAGLDGGGDGGSPAVEMGTGGIDVYEPITDGDTVELARGCQGGQHIWIGLRAWGLDTQPALIALRGTRIRDGEMAALPITVRLRFNQTGEVDQVLGLQLIVPDPDVVVGEEIEMTAQVSEDFTGGRTVTVSHRVNVAWGDETCGTRGDGGPTLDYDGGTDDGGPAPDGGLTHDGGLVGDGG